MYIKEILAKISKYLSYGSYIELESETIELKDLSTGNDWKSLRETVCAYLNTKGGYIICGIREKNATYTLTGFNRDNESRLIELQTKWFKNEQDILIDLSENILLSYQTLEDKTVAIVQVIPLSEDIKYIKYEGKYYERILTQDKIISAYKIQQQLEYKQEMLYAKETMPVIHANISDLSVEKINQFILKINANALTETLKKDIHDAIDFLKRRYCLHENGQVLLLGLLLFGKEPQFLLENKVRLDCYFGKIGEIGSAKKYLENDILTLIQEAFAFVWGHIEVGRSYKNGGESLPEFPELLIREVINNAIAHRDYSINLPVTVSIQAHQYFSIKNPGSFKAKMLIHNQVYHGAIRRILPGIPETKNPKLANILKTFDKIESQGIGMASLVNACLNNQIDVPYYNLSNPDMIELVIPSGKLIDKQMEIWMSQYRFYIARKLQKTPSEAHFAVLIYLLKSEKLNQKQYYTILLSHNNNHLVVLSDLIAAGLIFADAENSKENLPIYLLDKELNISDFMPIILRKTAINTEKYPTITSQILNIIYIHTYYNQQSIRASKIIDELYPLVIKEETLPINAENFGKKVRNICRKLAAENILIKHTDKSYSLPL